MLSGRFVVCSSLVRALSNVWSIKLWVIKLTMCVCAQVQILKLTDKWLCSQYKKYIGWIFTDIIDIALVLIITLC